MPLHIRELKTGKMQPERPTAFRKITAYLGKLLAPKRAGEESFPEEYRRQKELRDRIEKIKSLNYDPSTVIRKYGEKRMDYDEALTALVLIGVDAVPALLDAIKSKTKNQYSDSLACLMLQQFAKRNPGYGWDEAVSPLAEILESGGHDNTPVFASAALAEIGLQSVSSLVRIVNAGNPHARAYAANALADIYQAYPDYDWNQARSALFNAFRKKDYCCGMKSLVEGALAAFGEL